MYAVNAVVMLGSKVPFNNNQSVNDSQLVP